MTPKELDAWIRRYERHHRIPERIRDVEKWAAKIRVDAHAKKIDRLLAWTAAARRHFEGGDFMLALSDMREVESCVVGLNRAMAAPAFETGAKTRAALSRGRQASSAKRKGPIAERQAAADKVWTKNPRLSKAAVAQSVKRSLGLTVDAESIAKRLRPPK